MASASRFPHLFKPLVLNKGRVTLKNRVLMGSMHSGLEEVMKNNQLEAMAEYFAARARGQVGLIVTGGIAPNNAGRVKYLAAKLDTRDEVFRHKIVTDSVHDADGKICLQILHSGRYGYHHWAVSSSAIKSPISMFKPKALSSPAIQQTISDFVNCAVLASEAGYDGVEVMGSEGYLINQFICLESNKRTDEWGGSFENRIRLPLEIVQRTRQALGEDFIIIFRLSMQDLVAGGSTWQEVVELAQRLEQAGVSIINTGIGWHQARVPTIATAVPRGGFAHITKKLMGEVDIPLCTTNRINMPSTAEEILEGGYSDMVSMARPFLADPEFMVKAQEGRDDEINTCIGCNQGCLDHVFVMKRATCLVNPRAGYEADLELKPATEEQKASIKIAVIGAGPAGLACSVACAERGFTTTLFEKSAAIGGQFNLAKRVPGKEEFFETLRYFEKQLELHTSLETRMETEATAEALAEEGFTHVVVATGVVPRELTGRLEGAGHPNVVGYSDVLSGRVEVGERVAVIGAGGIGFDVAEFLSDKHSQLTDAAPSPGMASEEEVRDFCDEWGIDFENEHTGGLVPGVETMPASNRTIYMMQRGKGKVGANLGKTTGWIKRTQLKKRGVETMRAVSYDKVDEAGHLHISVKGKPRVLEVDHIVVCAGQESERSLWKDQTSNNWSTAQYFLIGGAEAAAEVDAKRAFDQGTRLAATLETAKTGEVFNQPVEFLSKVYTKAQSMGLV